MQLYNVLTHRKESFTVGSDAVTIYVCGITPYDTTHLGHSFTYASFDVLIRYLEHKGYRVKYAQNVTDIDDDILRKAKEVGGDWRELGNQWTTHFIRDMKALNIRPPEFYPRATDVIDQMLTIIQTLLDRGYAYERHGSVYFHVNGSHDFGKLSKIPRHEMLAVANQRGNRPDDPNKEDPLDFVLWQAHAPGEPSWDSPWGPGRPGWHIECSTMAAEYLGNTVDIHGGGSDLIFPHHECEIAQAECATGKKPFVRFWMHSAMVEHEGEKMSKSLGNLVMVRDLLEAGHHPDALRLYMHQHHYREVWSHDEVELDAAEARMRVLRQAITAQGGNKASLSVRGPVNTFTKAMEDDLDTFTALAAVEQFAHEIIAEAKAGRDVSNAQQTLREMCRVFGLYLDAEAPESRVVQGWEQHLTRFA